MKKNLEEYNNKLLGNGYKHILSPLTREALTLSYHILVEEMSDEYTDKELCLGLPSNFAYTNLQIEKFKKCLDIVGYKLGSKHFEWDLLSCTGEEIMLKTIIDNAYALIEMRAKDDEHDLGEEALETFKEEIAEFEDLVYQDSDFKLLFDYHQITIDKKRMEVLARGMGFSFSFSDVDTWFEEFTNSNIHVHPYVRNLKLGIHLQDKELV